MNPGTSFERVVAMINATLGAQSGTMRVPEGGITLDTRLVEDLEVDSIDRLDIITDVEDEFQIAIDDDRAETLRTVGDIVALIEPAGVTPDVVPY